MGSLGFPEVFKTQVLTERRVILGKASWNLRFQEGKTEVVSDLAANGRGEGAGFAFAVRFAPSASGNYQTLRSWDLREKRTRSNAIP